MIDKEIIKEVFKVYEDERYREQFNNAESMMKDLIKKALTLKEKEHSFACADNATHHNLLIERDNLKERLGIQDAKRRKEE